MTLAQMVIASLDAEIEKYEESLGQRPDPMFSSKHRRMINNAAKIANSKEKDSTATHGRKRHVSVRRFAVVALVAVLIMLTSVIVLAVVYPEYYMVIKERAKEWTITFVTEGDTGPSEDFHSKVGTTPEGFALTNESSEDGIYTASYTSDGDKEIIYVQQILSDYAVTGLDAENDYKKVEKFNGIKTIVTKKKDCYVMFWVHDNCSFTLVGNCNLDVLKAYAASIK